MSPGCEDDSTKSSIVWFLSPGLCDAIHWYIVNVRNSRANLHNLDRKLHQWITWHRDFRWPLTLAGRLLGQLRIGDHRSWVWLSLQLSMLNVEEIDQSSNNFSFGNLFISNFHGVFNWVESCNFYSKFKLSNQIYFVETLYLYLWKLNI